MEASLKDIKDIEDIEVRRPCSLGPVHPNAEITNKTIQMSNSFIIDIGIG